MQTLYFEKISQFDRQAEPVTVSIPFAKGSLKDVDKFSIYDGVTDNGATYDSATYDSAKCLSIQPRALARWDDGSIKWLLVHFQPDLPGNQSKRLSFSISETNTAKSRVSVRVEETTEGIKVDTGVLSFTVPRVGFLPFKDVVLENQPLWNNLPFKGFRAKVDGEQLGTVGGEVRLELEESGPLRAVILVHGKHQKSDGSPFLDFHGRITAYAGKAYVEVEHQFMHKEQTESLELESLNLSFKPSSSKLVSFKPVSFKPDGGSLSSKAKLALGQGFYKTEIQESSEALEMALTSETLLFQANEHFIDSFYGDFWVDWRDEYAGLTLSMYQAHQHFPKTLQVTQDGIDCWLYPDDAGPVKLRQGVAKTHRILLNFHSSDKPLADLSTRSLQFQLPDRPSLPRAWYEANNPWTETYFPEKLSDRLLTFFTKLHDGRPKALGMLHFGDAPDLHYSNQGRGQGQAVWVNNEYDRPHACTLFYGLSGQRRALDSAIVSARHWLDVDVCHYSPDPLTHQGLKIHTRDHVTGKVVPSHEWVDGFLDYYLLTGRAEALHVVKGIGENILRHMQTPDMRSFGSASVREAGWALRAMVGLYMGTGAERWQVEATRIVEMFLGWRDTYGALLAPYTSHSMPRVPFMISLTANSFARYLLIEDDTRIKSLIVETMDDLLEHCLGPDGLFVYKEFPSLQRGAPTPHALEALTHAYRITGNRRYLEVATRQFAALMERPLAGKQGGKYLDASGAVVDGKGSARNFADRYSSILVFASEATPLGYLDWYDYPF